ncbi:MAG: 2-C-methyl-D-erythritol 2,4-cyclodiphosphate synthase [Duncaniella sp.]|nr:2-C-methyl-D-erythritol 2,4-cyclodiphosphate synthase [Duncaniella sp.]
MIRIGQGYDVHKLVEGRKLILCGVEVPHSLGLLGHSDADVALHALADALLGAAAMRDIGYHFPDNDPAYKGADSRVLLRRVVEIIGSRGLCPYNVDVTIVAQRPKLLEYIPAMIGNVASDLRLPVESVSVKATTTEHLGFEGRGEGIAAMAVVTLREL